MNKILSLCSVLITIFTCCNIKADTRNSFKLKFGNSEEKQIITTTKYQETIIQYKYRNNPIHLLEAVTVHSSTDDGNNTITLLSNIQALGFPVRSQFLFNSHETNAFNILRYIQFHHPNNVNIFNSALIFLEGIPSFFVSNHELIDPIFYVNSVYFADGIYTLTASLENDNNKYDSEEDGNITIQISIEGHFISMTGISNFGIEFSLTPVEETVQLPNIFDLAPAFKSRINRQGDLTWLKTIK